MSVETPYFMISIAYIVAGLLITALEISAAVLLLRERHVSSWLMLAGGILTLIGLIASHFGSFILPRLMEVEQLPLSLMALSGISMLGSLVFAIGFIMHALHRRGLQSRIDELEATLSPQQHS